MKTTPPANPPLLEIQDLKVHFPVRRGLFSKHQAYVHAVDGVTLSLQAGETLGLVGESGCGKSTLGRAVARLVDATSGAIRFAGDDITALGTSKMRPYRRHLQMIFQDPYGSLNPRMTVAQIIGEALDIHRLARQTAARQRRIRELLLAVGLDADCQIRYPHEFSGGQRQRIGIARALAVHPKFLICDEPISALDVSVQAQIINLLADLQTEHGIAYLFIAHDLAVVEHLSRRIAVMYLGRIMELSEAGIILHAPRHPYTQALISALPTLDPASRRQRILLPGEIPSPINPPAGCPFHPRCPRAEDLCRAETPLLREIEPNHWSACHFS